MGRKSKSGFFGKILQLIISVIVLSAAVIGIAFFTKTLSVTTPQTLAHTFAPVLARLHIGVSEEQVGQVAGKFAERISETDLNIGSGLATKADDTSMTVNADTTPSTTTDNVILKVAIVADIHDDTTNLEKALHQAKDNGVSAVFVLGDLTNYGDIPSLTKIRTTLDSSGLTYYVIPGDHDLAKSVDDGGTGPENFAKIFGDKTKTKIDLGPNASFLMLNNSANFTKVPSSAVSDFENDLSSLENDVDLKIGFVLISQPLYAQGLGAPFNKMYMGSTKEDQTDTAIVAKQTDVQDQGQMFLSLIRDSAKVKAVIAGDHHLSSTLEDSSRADLKHYVVGAITNTSEIWGQEVPQKTLQSSRFSLLTLDDQGGYKVTDIVLK